MDTALLRLPFEATAHWAMGIDGPNVVQLLVLINPISFSLKKALPLHLEL